jgi:hypothetical protein
MRFILLIFMLWIASCTNNSSSGKETDIKAHGLKGKVKTMIEFIINKANPVITLKRVYTYNEQGMQHTYYEYVNEEIKTKRINTFNGQGVQTKRMFYQFKDGNVYNILEYQYKDGYEDKSIKPSEGDSIKIVIAEAADTSNTFFNNIHNSLYLDLKQVYFKDMFGYRETSALYCMDPHPGIEPQPFDAHGNWTREVIVGQYNEVCSLTERFFEYY